MKEKSIVQVFHKLYLFQNIFFQALMMDINETFALEFPFNPSKIRLEDIEIPEALKLPMLKKI